MLVAVPTVTPFFTRIKAGRPEAKFITAKSFSSRKSLLWRSKLNRFWTPINMTESNKASILRVCHGDEGVSDFEQEAFIDDSSQLSTNSSNVGLEVILNDASKWLVTAIIGVALLLRRDGEAMWAALGSVLNGGLSVILKQILNQERPTAVRSDPGMPSSHAQSLFFAVVYFIFSMVQSLGVNGVTTALSGLAIVLGSYFSWLRISLQFHTINQVIVGAAVGAIFSMFWFGCWYAIVFKAFTSYLWVRIFLVLGTAGFCVGCVLYIIRHCIMDETAD